MREQQTIVHQRVAAARAGTNPAVICKVPSGWVVMGDTQYVPGYCLLLPDPVVPDLNGLDKSVRSQFLNDMVMVGDALLEVTDAYRINYEILCNTDPVLHAHIIPRYMSEPENFRKKPIWAYDNAHVISPRFDPDKDKDLMRKIRVSIESRL